MKDKGSELSSTALFANQYSFQVEFTCCTITQNPEAAEVACSCVHVYAHVCVCVSEIGHVSLFFLALDEFRLFFAHAVMNK